jgi:iron complex outermembrane recepter protein
MTRNSYPDSWRRPTRFTRSQPLLSLATIAMLLSPSAGLLAQEDDETDEIIELDTFVVTSGIRESLAAGVEIKRNSPQIVDVLIAEDIGKFPDNNVVEALQRIPGVQTTDRTRGEVNTVTIRGLNDITTTVNGRNIFTASGRSLALADVPAALLNRVDVHKTRSASLIEHGIAGVIDIKTQRPFFFGEERTVLALRGIYSELADKLDPNVSALYTNVWETDYGRFGALVNVAYAQTNWTDKSVTAGAQLPFITETPPAGFTWGPLERIFEGHPSVVENPIWQAGLESGLPFNQGATLPMTPVGGTAPQNVPYYLARDAVFSADFYGKRERPAVNVSLQWAPDDHSTYTFEVFYNGYREDWNNNLMFSFADAWWALGPDPASTFTLVPGTNVIDTRTVHDQWMFMSGDKTVQSTDSLVYALTGEWKIGDSLTLSADLSHQTSEFETEFQGIQTNPGPWVTGIPTYNITVDFNAGKGAPAWRIGDNPVTLDVDESDLTDPRLWNVGPFFDNAAKNDGSATEFVFRGDYRPREISFIENVKFGLRLDNREASEGSYSRDVITPGFAGGVWDLNRPLADFPDWQRINTGYYDGRADIPQAAMVIDADYLHRNADEFRTLWGYPTSEDIKVRKNFEITEKNFSAYLQTDFRFEFGEQALSGQVGVRYVMVGRDLGFFSYSQNDDGELESFVDSATSSGDRFLPNIILLYDFTPRVRLRASYGETLRYPGFGSLNPNITYVPDVTDIGYGTAGGGNPDLGPTESKNYDLSLEYYFGDTNLIYATAFRREIDGLVVNFRNRVIFDDYPYILSQPGNASNGELEGFEFGLIWFPQNVPDWLNGFGIQASYTILDSIQDIPIQDVAGNIVGTETTPFFAVSDASYSLVLAYERPKYSVRLSHVWRDDFLNNYEAALFANPLGVYRTAQESLDLQVTYKITDNWVLTFDATNLTDEEYHSYYADPSINHDFRETHNFGNWLISRTFAVGTRFSF